MKNTVSAIVPTRDRREMAVQALTSIVNQTRPPEEIIVADDGDGGTGALLAKLFENVRAIHTAGRGAAAARNEAASLARGDWLAFCDDDDTWQPQRLEAQLAAVTDEADLFYADALCSDGRRALEEREAREGLVFGSLLLDNWIPTSTVLLRRSSFEKAGGFEARFCPAEDYRLWLRLSHFGRFVKIDKPLAVYRQHPGQLQADTARMAGATADVVEDALGEAGWRTTQIPNLTTRLRELRFVQARALMAEGRRGEARRAYGRAWRHQPAYLKAPLFWALSFFGK